MKNCFAKVLSALCLAALAGCGANNAANVNGGAAPGAISANLVWGGSAANKSAKALAAVPSNVAKVQLTVTGTGTSGAIPVARNTITVSGGSASGSVSGIYPGTVAVAVKALDSGNATVYEGFALNVNVAAGVTTDVGTITMTVPYDSDKPENQPCLGCHETSLDATGQNIIANYKATGHYSNVALTDANGQKAGCVGCHGANHDTPNPFATGRCFDCHSTKVAVHFNSVTGSVHPAQYVSTNEQCTSCHQAHNVNVGQNERVAWAQSAHGDVNGAPWSDEDFQQPGQAGCQRCHTGTGFKNFAISNLQTFPTTSIAAADDTKREVLGCDGCHTDNKFGVRTVGAFTAQYKIKNNTVNPTFPDVAESNLCIACHSARENGVDAVADFTNASFKNSHYLPAAALMYMSSGFTNFTSASAAIGTSTYGKTLSPDNVTVPNYGISGGVSSTHRKLGTTAIQGDNHNPAVFVAGQFDTNGPCVVCHMNATGAPAGTRAAHGHTLAIDENAYNQVCVNCHGSENNVPLTATNFKSVFLDPQSEAFQAALKLAVALLKSNFNIEYDSGAYPYFFKGGMAHISANAVKDWTNGTANQVFGKKLMGACFNIQLLTKDSAAYAHARSYSRRLIYDSIDFLDDGKMNLSVGATALLSGLTDANGATLFTKAAKAYTDNQTVSNGKYGISTIYPGTSEAMLYLIAWNRSGSNADNGSLTKGDTNTVIGDDAVNGAGSWSSIERP